MGNPYIEEEQKTQWTNEKVQKDKERSTKHAHKSKDRITRTPLKTGDGLWFSGRVTNSCYTSGTRRVNLAVFIYAYTSVKHTSDIVSLNSNTTGISSSEGHAYPSDSPKFTPDFFSGLSCAIFSFLCSVL